MFCTSEMLMCSVETARCQLVGRPDAATSLCLTAADGLHMDTEVDMGKPPPWLQLQDWGKICPERVAPVGMAALSPQSPFSK